jgi:hypothetical protein
MIQAVEVFVANLQAMKPGERIEAIRQFGGVSQEMYFYALDEVREHMRERKNNKDMEGRA